MFNAWDFVFALLLLLSAFLGWKLKSLPLLGLGFAFAVAPLLATKFSPELGTLLVDQLGGEGLKPYQNQVAWWIIAIATGLLLWMLFNGLSKMLASLKLEFLDRGFGALICGVIFTACLSLNMARFSQSCSDRFRKPMVASWSWAHVRSGQEPQWIQDLANKVELLKQVKPAAENTKSKFKKKAPIKRF